MTADFNIVLERELDELLSALNEKDVSNSWLECVEPQPFKSVCLQNRAGEA